MLAWEVNSDPREIGQERDEHAPESAIAVQEGAQRLEFRMWDGKLHQPVWLLGMQVVLSSLKASGNAARSRTARRRCYTRRGSERATRTRGHMSGGGLHLLPCVDHHDKVAVGAARWRMSRDRAAKLGQTAVEVTERGWYLDRSGHKVDWSAEVARAAAAKRSIPPDEPLPAWEQRGVETRVQVLNQSTLRAARRLVDQGARPLALNFANGIHPGGGFLHGSRAQEEELCRSSALYLTLRDDPMYDYHAQRPEPDSTDWAIYSPDVPVFRNDDGSELERPWLLSFITSAAPYAPKIGQPRSGDLLEQRIHRILAIAAAFGHRQLVLGAWGCGAFHNDPQRTALDFRRALEGEFSGVFDEVLFAITDWSPERRFLGPFRDVFSA